VEIVHHRFTFLIGKLFELALNQIHGRFHGEIEFGFLFRHKLILLMLGMISQHSY